jgi:hypothetical protein
VLARTYKAQQILNMPKAPLWAKNVSKLKGSSEGVRYYFWMLEELLENVSSPEPALAYCFQNIEYAQRVALYAILMRRYRTNSELTWKAIDDLDITRSNFPEFYQVFCGKKYPAALREKMKPAEAVRDKITHGREAATSEVHRAIGICLDFAEDLNVHMWKDVGFRPFGKLRGVTSSTRPQLEKEISHLVLKGLGLYRARAKQQSLPQESAEI